jgi:hypothetical protein
MMVLCGTLVVDKEEGNTYTSDNKKIRLLIIFTAIGSVISGAALLPSYHLSQVAAQQAGSNADLSLSMLRQHGAHQLIINKPHIYIFN